MKCQICGEIRKTYKSKTDDTQRCNKCRKNKGVCIICNKHKTICKNGPICDSCNRILNKIECSVCGNKRNIAIRIDNEPICQSCYWQMNMNICKCGKIAYLVTKGGLCGTCYKRSMKVECDICGKLSHVEIRKGGKAKCRSCYRKHRNTYDLNYKILEQLRKRLYDAFVKYSINGKIKNADEYGIDYGAIIEHLTPFPDNIEEYHIDHIFPLSAFDFTNLLHIKAAFAPENHQWLKKEENMKKSNKYNKQEFAQYLEVKCG